MKLSFCIPFYLLKTEFNHFNFLLFAKNRSFFRHDFIVLLSFYLNWGLYYLQRWRFAKHLRWRSKKNVGTCYCKVDLCRSLVKTDRSFVMMLSFCIPFYLLKTEFNHFTFLLFAKNRSFFRHDFIVLLSFYLIEVCIIYKGDVSPICFRW